MIIIGHELVVFKPFYRIQSVWDIEKTAPNSTVLFKFDSDILKFCQKNGVSFAIETTDIKEVVLANAAGAAYIVAEGKKNAKAIQDLAENYLFDAKILLKIKDEDDIEKAAKNGIDGVLLPQGVIHGDL